MPSARAFLADRVLALLPSRAESLLIEDLLPRGDRPSGYEVKNGVAMITIRGSLVNRAHDAWFGDLSYETLHQTVDAVLADPTARAVVLDVDTAGGEASGAMELAAHIRAASARKPVIGFVDGLAASAGYALLSAAQEVVVTPSSTIGSIGTVLVHWDLSRMFDAAGVKPTLLHAGAHKIDGNPLKPLGSAAAARLQNLLDVHMNNFVETVGKHRKALGAAGARATEAGIFIGRAAVDAKLADRLGTRADAIAAALARANAPRPIQTSQRKIPAMAENRPAAESEQDRADALAMALAGANSTKAENLIGKSDYERGRADFAALHGKKIDALPAGSAAFPEARLPGGPALDEEQVAAMERGRKEMASALGKPLIGA